MTVQDAFSELARYYDPIMAHVNYDRWFVVATGLAELLPPNFRHLDAGCGTGVLVNMLRGAGWRSVGVDISPAMVQTGRRMRGAVPLGVADLRALPFRNTFDCCTCLFDSINFLLEEEEVRGAIHELAQALVPGGVLYFDMVTERMVTEHFAGQTWDEDNGGFRSLWSSRYDKRTACTETSIRINSGGHSLIRERIYPRKFFEQCIQEAGLSLCSVLDAEHWKRPGRRSTRLDFIAMKAPAAEAKRRFKPVLREIQRHLA